MGKLNLYIRGKNSIYHYENKKEERGFITQDEIKEYIDKKEIDHINFILSKPDVIFRKLSFDFQDIKKIKMILPSELEESLPEKIDNYLLNYKFFKYEKKTSVNITGIKKQFYETLTSFTKGRKKTSFFLDTEILFNFFKNIVKKKDHIEIYIDRFYILINIVEKEGISACISYTFEEANSEKIISIVNKILNEKKYPVYITGEEAEIEKFQNITNLQMEKIKTLDRELQPFFFTEILKSQKIKIPPVKFSKPEIKVISLTPVFISILIVLFLSIIPFNSYKQLKKKEKDLEKIETLMINEFRKVFPDVKKIVDPVVQTKERLNQATNTNISMQYPSILEILLNVTNVFPENIKVEIDQLSFSNNILTVSGFIDNLTNLEKVKEAINNSSYFSNLEIGSVSFDRNNRVNFSLTMKIKK